MSENGNRTVATGGGPQQKVVPAPFARRRPATEAVSRQRMAQAAERKKPRRQRRWVGYSYVLLVLLPTFVVSLYYALISADQYMVETRFAVRNASMSTGSSLLSTLGLGLGGTSVSDTYIVLEYIHSREIIDRIGADLDLKRLFRRVPTDYYASLPEDATREELLEYWEWMVEVNLDHTSQILTVRTYAFTPRDARDLAAAILRESERKINELSEKARRDAVAYAEEEVRKAEERVRRIRQRFLQFRNKTQQIDPAKQAQVQLMLIGKLEEQLTDLRTKLSEARSYLSETAPSVVFLKNRIRAVEKQIAEERRKLGDKKNLAMPGKAAGDGTLSRTLSEYEELLVEREFAEKFYLSALRGLEEARLLANRQQRYLATFEAPYLPDEALYPKRIRNTIFVFLALSLFWGLGMLLAQSIRDRL